MALTTTNKFGIQPNASSTGMLMPKLKNRFSVVVTGPGWSAAGITSATFTQQVVTCTRPQVQYDNTPLHSYNNIAYIPQKPQWQPIELTLRDDITGLVSGLVSAQNQSQMNFFTQSSGTAGIDYKFTTDIYTLDGTSGVANVAGGNILEQWHLEGCYLEQIQYDGFDFSSSEPVIITLSIRYDNATQGDEQNLDNLPLSNQGSTATGGF